MKEFDGKNVTIMSCSDCNIIKIKLKRIKCGIVIMKMVHGLLMQV